MGKRTNRHTIKHIPQDIIEDILVNLPVKSLLRFKCVSKPWRSMISSNHFTKEHLKISKSSDLIRHNLIYKSYLYDRTGHTLMSCPRGIPITCSRCLGSCSLKSFIDEQNYEDYSMVTTSYHDSFLPSSGLVDHIVGSCNGLILISSRINRYWQDLIMWNPSTRQVKIIPPPLYGRRKRYRNLDYFAYGFGYDDSTDDYKVVCVFVSKIGLYKTQMYSLRTNSWKKIRNFENYYSDLCSGTHVNGKLHWLPARGYDIVSLSLVDEKYDIVALPLHFSKYHRDSYYILDDLGGYLCLMRDDSIYGSVSIWVMMKYGEVESWINIRSGLNVIDQMSPFSGRPQPIWLTKNGDLAVAFSGSRVVVSNIKDKSRVFAVDSEILMHNIYVESLVSPYQKLGH